MASFLAQATVLGLLAGLMALSISLGVPAPAAIAMATVGFVIGRVMEWRQ